MDRQYLRRTSRYGGGGRDGGDGDGDGDGDDGGSGNDGDGDDGGDGSVFLPHRVLSVASLLGLSQPAPSQPTAFQPASFQLVLFLLAHFAPMQRQEQRRPSSSAQPMREHF
jgi:hypothetical protein